MGIKGTGLGVVIVGFLLMLVGLRLAGGPCGMGLIALLPGLVVVIIGLVLQRRARTHPQIQFGRHFR